MEKQYLSKLLKELRIKNNLTQYHLGKTLLGKSQSYYSRLEAGKEELTIAEAKILASAYSISLDVFFDENEPSNKIFKPINTVSTDSFKEHLSKCVKDEAYYKLFKAYIKICQEKGISPEL